MDEDPADRLEGTLSVDDDAGRVGDEFAIEIGEDDEIELEPLRFVDRHHADRRHDRIGDVHRPAVVDERGGSHQSIAALSPFEIPFAGRGDELLEPTEISVRA